jgi:hypothetical protein
MSKLMPQTLSDTLTLAALMDAPQSGHPLFTYDAKAQKYFYKGSKKPVSKAAFEKLTNDHILRKKADLRKIGDRFTEKGSFVAFQKDGWKTIKTTFAQQYILGRGGVGKMADSDYATLKKELRYQSKMWRGFAVDIKAGNVSSAQMQMRLGMYGEASKVAFFDGQTAAAIAAGMTEELNVMNSALENCEGCIERTNRGWQPIGTLGRITKGTPCMVHCGCGRKTRKGKKRSDAIPTNLIKKVITNVQGEEQTVYVAPEENKTTKLVKQHITKTLQTDELPSRGEILQVGVAAIGDYFKNPVQAVKDGFKREQAARDAYKLAFGKEAPTKMQVTGKAMKLAGKKMKEFALSTDGAVATAGITGSIVGGAVAGPAGALAGDLLGSLAVRKIGEAHQAYKKSQEGMKDAEPWDDTNAVSKLKLKADKTLSELKTPEMQQAIEKELVGDVAGWAIGNGVAMAVGKAVPGLSWVPSGAVAAMASVPTVVVPMAKKAHRLREQGASPADAAKTAFSETFGAAGRKEKAARAAFTSRIKQMKQLTGIYAPN